MNPSNSARHDEPGSPLPVERARLTFSKRTAWVSAAFLVLFALMATLMPMACRTGGTSFSWLIKLPHTRDARLVGTWKGPAQNPWGGTPLILTLTLSPDGAAGYSLDNRPTKACEWGTEDGVLYFRELAVDAWEGLASPYTLSADGRRVSFSRTEEFGPVASEMRLQTRPSAGPRAPASR